MDVTAIRTRWAGRAWRYVERRLGKNKSFLAECTLMIDGRTSGIWLDEPQPVEAEVLQAAAQAPNDVRALLARIDELEAALRRATEGDVDEARSVLAAEQDPDLAMFALSRLASPPPAVVTALHRWRFEDDAETAAILADLKIALEQA